MKGAILTLDGFKIIAEDVPRHADDEILVKLIGCGVCSGDLFVYRNRNQLGTTVKRLGHEGSGRVVGVGRDVTGLELDDLVTTFAAPAYAEYIVARPETVVKLPARVDPVYALGEAIACCVHAANRFELRPGDRVAVLGCGFMGLICLQLARYHGAGDICAVDPLADRLEMGRRFGATAILNPLEQSDEQIGNQLGEFDLVIEAAGTQGAIDLSTTLVKEHGRIVLIGYHQSNDGLRTVNMERWNYKAIDVVNGHVRRRDEKLAAMEKGMKLLSQGHLWTEPLVTTYNLYEAEQAFADLSAGKVGLFKAVLAM
ncbi:MAG: zinc-binding dehydrogenase [Chloroflexota bacterium]|nr:MAG: zinc-binding dehydrogenase [Chloroflexota bacterium]